MARRRTLITYLGAFLFGLATVLRGLLRYRGLPVYGRVVGLSAAFLLLLLIEPFLTHRSRWFTHRYMLVQTGIVTALLLTRPYEDFGAGLFVSLTLQAMHVFQPPAGWRWTGLFTLVTAAILLLGLGWRQGLSRFVTYAAAYFISGLLVIIARQAEHTRAESQRLLADLQFAHQRLQIYATQVALISEVGQRVSGELELDALLSEIVTAVHDAFDYHNVGLFLLAADEASADEASGDTASLDAPSADAERMTLTSIAGAHADIFGEGFSIAVEEGMTGHAAASGQTQVSGDVREDPRYVRMAEEETQSEMAVPILSGNKVIGVLDIQSSQLDAFREIDRIAMETLSTQVAAAIENARLYKAAQRELAERVQAEKRLREAKEGAEKARTAAEQARAAAEEARVAAEEANRAKSVFLANMSHELRTPLNAILGFAQLMSRDPVLTAEQMDNLGTIERSGEHLLGLINDVLELSKIEAGRAVLNETNFDLHRLLDGLEEMFRLRATDKGLMLIFDRASSVPQYVRTDEGKLRQVLMNILGNAVKYTQEGGITLRVGCLAARGGMSTSGREFCLSIEVEDTGPGIAPEEADAVFDPFKQTSTGQQSREGTGLGMPISRQFVRLMGGELTFSSEVGTGTLFKFDVPIERADVADVPTARPRRRVIGMEPPGDPAAGPYRLLVAEDREASRKLLVKLLAPLGFEMREAANGREAIEIWERWNPHLIWMDVRMPVMDGQEATQHIKATPQGRDTAIVALTASAFEEDRAALLLAGCDDFVRKPFREQEILDVLTKHLGVHFVYEGAEEGEVAEDVLTPDSLAALPPEWVAELSRAARQADADLVLELLDQMREQHAPLANALATLVRDFRFDRVIALTQVDNA